MGDPLAEAQEFLRTLYPTPVEGWIVICSDRDGGFHKEGAYPITDLEQLGEWAVKLGATCNVWFGVCPQLGCPSGTARGEERGVGVVPALFADLDLKKGCSEEEIERLLDEFPLPPSLVLHSGNGFHVYWLLDRLWEVAEVEEAEKPEERTRAKELNLRLHRALCDRAGVEFDNVQDLARVLRLPGTVNRKDAANPKPVQTVRPFTGARYSVEHLDDNLPALVKRPSNEAGDPERHPNGNQRSIRALLATYVERARTGVDDGRNDSGLKLACQLRDEGYTRDDAEDVMLDFQRQVADLKCDEPPYTSNEALASTRSAYSRPPRQPSGSPGWDASRAREDPSEAVQRELAHLVVRERARDLLREQKAEATFVVPPSRLTLADELDEDEPPLSYTIERLHQRGMNTSITAQYKTGKTTLLGNLTRALCDGEPFLGQLAVREPAGRVAFLNYELGERQFREWARGWGIRRPDRATVLNLRGYDLNLASDHVRAWLVGWLREREVEVLLVDPFARAYHDDENDNALVKRWTDVIDLIKREAGVEDLFVSLHTGRQRDEDRARGATRLDDWVDARWILTRDQTGNRFLRAEGRDVAFEESLLVFDEPNRRLELSQTGGNRREIRLEEGVRRVLLALAETEPLPQRALRTAMGGRTDDASTFISRAIGQGLVVTAPGPGRAVHHRLTEAGRARVEGPFDWFPGLEPPVTSDGRFGRQGTAK